jgi:hypothetical protein
MIIGISGLAGAGKDTVADFLVKHQQCVKVSFADPMKRAVRDWFGWDVERLWGPSEKRNEPDPQYNGLSARKALQFLGTEIGRELYPNIWVDYALRQAKFILEEPGGCYEPRVGAARATKISDEGEFIDESERVAGVIFPDCRFRNEIDGIKAAGGKLIRIYRPQAGLEGAAAQHKSETEQKEIPDYLFDYGIHNVGTLEALELTTLRVWEALLTGRLPHPSALEDETGSGIYVTTLIGGQ